MNKPITYIFVHGAWHGAWCWQKVLLLMQQAGKVAIAHDLPGHGTASQVPRIEVTFSRYVESLTELIRQQPNPVILVGHSMAGMLISQMAEMLTDQIAKLIYVAAYIPSDKQSLLDLANACQSRALQPYTELNQQENTLYLRSSPKLAKIFYQQASDEDQQWALSQLQPQPFEPFCARVQLGAGFHDVEKAVILCENDKIIHYQDQVKMSNRITQQHSVLPSDHSPFLSSPHALVQAILTC